MLPVSYFTQFWFKAGIKPFKKKRAFFYYEEFYISGIPWRQTISCNCVTESWIIIGKEVYEILADKHTDTDPVTFV